MGLRWRRWLRVGLPHRTIVGGMAIPNICVASATTPIVGATPICPESFVALRTWSRQGASHGTRQQRPRNQECAIGRRRGNVPTCRARCTTRSASRCRASTRVCLRPAKRCMPTSRIVMLIPCAFRSSAHHSGTKPAQICRIRMKVADSEPRFADFLTHRVEPKSAPRAGQFWDYLGPTGAKFGRTSAEFGGGLGANAPNVGRIGPNLCRCHCHPASSAVRYQRARASGM